MHEFRLYLLGGDNEIVWASWVEAADLRSAISEVGDRYNGVCEIWDGPERLATVQPSLSDAASLRS